MRKCVEFCGPLPAGSCLVGFLVGFCFFGICLLLLFYCCLMFVTFITVLIIFRCAILFVVDNNNKSYISGAYTKQNPQRKIKGKLQILMYR